jgi:hypothetical protein
MAFPKAGASQMAVMLFFAWIVVTSVTLARRPRLGAGTAPVGARA